MRNSPPFSTLHFWRIMRSLCFDKTTVCTFSPFPPGFSPRSDGGEGRRKIDDRSRELDRCQNMHLIVVSLNTALGVVGLCRHSRGIQSTLKHRPGF